MRTTCAILAALVAAGCSTQRTPPGELRAVTPSEVLPSWAGVLAIEGAGLAPRLRADFDRPAASEASYGYRARLEGGGAAIELSNVLWNSESSLSATLAPGTAPGTYALVATDPFDRELRLEAAVTVRSECSSDADCATAPICQLGPGRCEQGVCRFELAADGAGCDDGNLCTEQEHCDGAGQCKGVAVSCAAPSTNGCTEAVAACVPDQGCTVRTLPAGTACGGTDACGASPGACDGQGGCVGAVTSCATPPDPSCQRPGSCDASGTCAYPAVVCDAPPNTQCYLPAGTCVSGSGCSYTLRAGSCDDGDPCTVGDACGGDGTCRGTYDPSQCGAVNLPPIACVTVSPTAVIAGQPVSVSVECSSDREDPLANLKVRVDFDGDGTWDANASYLATPKQWSHAFASAGIYAVKVEVQDSGGLVAWAEKRVAVAASVADLLVVTTEKMNEDDGTIDPTRGTGTSLTEALKKVSADKVTGRVIAFARDAMKLTGSAVTSFDVPRTALIGRPGVALQFSSSTGSTPCLQVAADGVQVIGIEAYDCAHHLIQAKNDGVVIAENYLHRGTKNGLAIKLSAPTGLTFGPENLVTEWSGSEPAVTFKGSGSGVRIVGNELRENHNAVETSLPGAVIERNVFEGNSGVGVLIGGGSDGAQVRFNTFHGNGGNAVELSMTTGVSVRDNLFSNNTGWAISGATLGAAGEPNGYWQNGAGNLSSGAPGATSVIGDPRYVSAAADDFRLQPGSPMINTGAAISGTDLNGSKPGSFDGAAPDLGARESPF